MLNRMHTSVLGFALLAFGPLAIHADDAGEPLAAAVAHRGSLTGQVSTSAQPLEGSWIYAYELAEMSFRKVLSDGQGRFLFDRLPAGLYKVIAYKSGFTPSVALLTRATAEARQFLELELVAEEPVEVEDATGFWSIRERIPGDVLRDIEVLEAGEDQLAQDFSTHPDRSLFDVPIEAEMRAVAGFENGLELGDAQLAGGSVGVRGAMGDLDIGLTGNFVEALPVAGATSDTSASGRQQLVSINLGHQSGTDVSVTSLNNTMSSQLGRGNPKPVDFARHRVSWTQRVGELGQSDFSAQYTEESNFYRRGPISPAGIPSSSKSWDVAGSYTAAPTQNSNIRAGFRLRERESEYEGRRFNSFAQVPSERVDVFGRGGLQLKPAMLVEFGLYSTLRDGSLSLAPSGGVVFQLGGNWQAATAASLQVHEDDEYALLHRGFSPAYYGDYRSCEQNDQYCAQMLLTHTSEQGDGSLSIGATHRRFAETLRLYFDDDFFNRLESLYLVDGDSLPELQFALTRRLSRRILTRLESSVAAGGGGLLRGRGQSRYENQVQFMVTSLDTQFEQTSTGVFLAFHHLAQQLNPVGERRQREQAMQLERLQVVLTQDLDFLRRVASDLALHLNMEVSRGSTADGSYHDDEEIRKRITGGVAVKF